MRLPHIYMKSSQIANRAYNLEPIRHGPLIKFSPNHSEWSQEWCTIFTAGDEIIAAHSSARADTPGGKCISPKQTHADGCEREEHLPGRAAGRTPSIQLCAQHASLTGICSSLLHRRVSIKNVNLLPDFPDERTTTMPFDSLYNYRSEEKKRVSRNIIKMRLLALGVRELWSGARNGPPPGPHRSTYTHVIAGSDNAQLPGWKIEV
jgi:hypothetical protein